METKSLDNFLVMSFFCDIYEVIVRINHLTIYRKTSSAEQHKRIVDKKNISKMRSIFGEHIALLHRQTGGY